ncbi:MAG: hypothetical protein K6F97_09795 [Lachnospiraceae bacterium]|nr:hypothetical protein [Lachnospiraceae bacterium]
MYAGIDIYENGIYLCISDAKEELADAEYISYTQAGSKEGAIARIIKKLSLSKINAPLMVTGLQDEQVLSELKSITENILYIKHSQTFMYYAASLGETLVGEQVMIIEDEEEKGFSSIVLDVVRRPKVRRKSLSIGNVDENIFFVLHERKIEEKDLNLAVIKLSGGKHASVVFVLGEANDERMKDLKKLAQSHKVFLGNNLFVQGLIYAADYLYGKNSVKQGFLKDTLFFIDDDHIAMNISLRLGDGDEGYYPLVYAGEDISASAKVQVIPENQNEIEFLVDDVRRKEPVHEIMTLGIDEKSEKKRCFELTLRFEGRNTPIVKISELGFTSLWPKSYRVWEQILR